MPGPWPLASLLPPGSPWLAGLGGLLGLAVGSFLATLVVRAAQGLPLTGRSRCDSCRAPLPAAALLPLLAFAAQRGRCRHCGTAIDPVHPALEAAAALVGALALGLLGPGPGLAGALFGWLLLAAAALDLRHHWLPDWLTLPLLALGLGLSLARDPSGFPAQAAAAGGFLLLFWLVREAHFRLRGCEGLGLGDVKLAAALGAWVNPVLLPPLLLLAALAGLLWAAFVRARAGAGAEGTAVGAGQGAGQTAGPGAGGAGAGAGGAGAGAGQAAGQGGRGAGQGPGEGLASPPQAGWPEVPLGAFLAAAAWPLWLAAALADAS
ncbi:A24 family peptidase [Thermaurantiacus tibetensis]|uniref:prepilin peptidase n=1 Tax=Thermaurantiacus tibetensis TaxID=2759035 RepID=UPI00188F4022|nr:A24 family peptidase [Thermaurantiacus tibetensis]